MSIEPLLSNVNPIKIMGKKTYVNENDKKVPRVTEILSYTMNEEYIAQWANGLGFKKLSYRKEVDKAANIGLEAHECIERYLNDGTLSMNISFLAFLDWWELINKNNEVEIIGSEETLIGEYFGGTYDLLIKINGKIYLVDFKTSNHISYKHFIQLSAYRYLLYTKKNINIDGAIILQLNKVHTTFTEYVLDFSNVVHYNYIENCREAFLSCVYSYYNTKYIKSEFKNLFGGKY